MKYLFAFSLFFLSLPALADSVSVRAGFKDEYTRLVITTPEGLIWSINDELGFTEIIFSGSIDEFDLKDVFSRIPKKRISNIQSNTPNTLRVDLICDCEVRSFQWRPNKFVVDFIGNDEIFARPKFREIAQPQLTETNLPPAASIPTPTRAPLPEKIVAAERERDLKSLEMALAQSIGAAASQGFLQADTKNLPHAPATDGQLIDTRLESDIGLRSHTGLELNDPNELKVANSACPLAEWTTFLGPNAPLLGESLGRTRQELALAHRLDTAQATIKLAELYLANGFGVEASSLLNNLEERSPHIDFLIALGQLVDGVPLSRGLPPAEQCDGPIQLFAVLADDKEPALTDEESKQIARAYLSLPPALQSRFKGVLADRLLQSGAHDPAHLISDAPSDFRDPRDKRLTLVSAQLSALYGEQETPLPTTVEAAELSHDPGLVAELIEASLAEGFKPDQTVLSLATTMSYELRGSEEGQRLNLARIKAEISHGDLRDAETLMASSKLEPVDEQTLQAQWLRAVTERGEPDLFLESAFELSPYSFPADLRRRVASRVGESGFPDMARLWHPDAAGAKASDHETTDTSEHAPKANETEPHNDPISHIESASHAPILETENPIASGRALLAEASEMREKIKLVLDNKPTQ